jgi:hypothetical protein
MKKKWDKPELTVLVRGNAEEAVLTACKGGGVGGPLTQTHECRVPPADPTGCTSCHATIPAACSAVAAS